MGLDAVTFLIVIGEVQHLEGDGGPQGANHFGIQTAHVCHDRLLGQHSAFIDTLKEKCSR